MCVWGKKLTRERTEVFGETLPQRDLGDNKYRRDSRITGRESTRVPDKLVLRDTKFWRWWWWPSSESSERPRRVDCYIGSTETSVTMLYSTRQGVTNQKTWVPDSELALFVWRWWFVNPHVKIFYKLQSLAVLLIRRLDTGFLTRRPGFDHGSVRA